MKNLIFAITFIMALTIVNISSAYADIINVTGDKSDYVFEFREPYVDDNSMYIVYLLEHLETGVHTVQLQYFTTIPRYTTDSEQYDWSDDVFYGLYLGSATSKIYFNVSSTTMARAFSCRVARANTSIFTVVNSTFTTQTSCEVNWTNIGYKCIGYEIIGSNYTIESGIAGKTSFTYWFSNEYSQINLMFDILQEIALTNELSADQLDLLGTILDEIQSNGVTIDSLLSIMRDLELNTDQLDYYLDLIYKNVNNIYDKTDEVEYYLDLLYKQLNQIYNNTDDVEELVQELIDLFTPEVDDSEYPEVDTSKQDQYIEVGKDLTSKDTTNQQQDLNIEVNNNAGGYIWNLFNNFISSNSKVIGMYITLLSCAFIALILGR